MGTVVPTSLSRPYREQQRDEQPGAETAGSVEIFFLERPVRAYVSSRDGHGQGDNSLDARFFSRAHGFSVGRDSFLLINSRVVCWDGEKAQGDLEMSGPL